MSRLINWILNHTGKRWVEAYEADIRIHLAADRMMERN